MLYEAIRKGCELYQANTTFNLVYDNYLRNRNQDLWNRPETLTYEETYRLVVFLNKFLCRMDYKYVSDLQSVLKVALPYLNFLDSSKTILDIDFDGSVESLRIDNRWMKVSEIIQLGYSLLLQCPDVGDTVASKILHSINPALFVMWDDSIRGGYGLNDKKISGSTRYVNYFLPRMQNLAEFTIRQVQLREKLSRTDAIISLKSGNCSHSLAKVLDEYNYMKFTRNNEQVWENEYDSTLKLKD